MTYSVIFSILGLICDTVAGIFFLPKIFITDEEIERLINLPIEASTTNMTGQKSGEKRPVAVTDIGYINEYRSTYIKARKDERDKGKKGLFFFVAGSILQIIGVLLSVFVM